MFRIWGEMFYENCAIEQEITILSDGSETLVITS